ncbi:MAG: Ivy family c-type lysozyme inhibitor [Methylobacterium radiotolerans]
MRHRLAHAIAVLAALAPLQADAGEPLGPALTFPRVVAGNPAYRTAWNGLLAEIPAADRDAAFMRTLAGPATPMHAVRGDGRLLMVGTVCEPRNCNANDVIVIMVPPMGRMYALHRRRVDVPLRQRFLGHPDAAIRAILVEQAKLADRPQAAR